MGYVKTTPRFTSILKAAEKGRTKTNIRGKLFSTFSFLERTSTVCGDSYLS